MAYLKSKSVVIVMIYNIRESFYSALYNTILDTDELEKTNTVLKKKNQNMHGMHRHQAKRKRENAYRSKEQKQCTNM